MPSHLIFLLRKKRYVFRCWIGGAKPAHVQRHLSFLCKSSRLPKRGADLRQSTFMPIARGDVPGHITYVLLESHEQESNEQLLR